MESQEFEHGQESEPTNAEYAEACRELVTKEEYLSLLELVEELESADFLGHVFTVLEPYVDDPEEYLRSKGNLQ